MNHRRANPRQAQTQEKSIKWKKLNKSMGSSNKKLCSNLKRSIKSCAHKATFSNNIFLFGRIYIKITETKLSTVLVMYWEAKRNKKQT